MGRTCRRAKTAGFNAALETANRKIIIPNRAPIYVVQSQTSEIITLETPTVSSDGDEYFECQ